MLDKIIKPNAGSMRENHSYHKENTKFKQNRREGLIQ